MILFIFAGVLQLLIWLLAKDPLYYKNNFYKLVFMQEFVIVAIVSGVVFEFFKALLK